MVSIQEQFVIKSGLWCVHVRYLNLGQKSLGFFGTQIFQPWNSGVIKFIAPSIRNPGVKRVERNGIFSRYRLFLKRVYFSRLFLTCLQTPGLWSGWRGWGLHWISHTQGIWLWAWQISGYSCVILRAKVSSPMFCKYIAKDIKIQW